MESANVFPLNDTLSGSCPYCNHIQTFFPTEASVIVCDDCGSPFEMTVHDDRRDYFDTRYFVREAAGATD